VNHLSSAKRAGNLDLTLASGYTDLSAAALAAVYLMGLSHRDPQLDKFNLLQKFLIFFTAFVDVFGTDTVNHINYAEPGQNIQKGRPKYCRYQAENSRYPEHQHTDLIPTVSSYHESL
jgi:hypothetical protein